METFPPSEIDQVPLEDKITEDVFQNSKQENNVNLCKLCLNSAKLYTTRYVRFTKRHDNFKFLENELHFSLPLEVCKTCLEKLREILLFIRRCKESYEVYIKMQENTILKQEEIDIKEELFEMEEIEFNLSNDDLLEVDNSNSHDVADRIKDETVNLVIEDIKIEKCIKFETREVQIVDMMESNGELSDLDCPPPEILEAAKENTLDLLPIKTKERYEFAYSQFVNWRKQKGINLSFSENVFMAYFGELSTKIAPSTLWPQYSMLKSTIRIHHDVDIAQYVKLRAFIKRQSIGYKRKKSKTLTTEEINRYLREAPDDTHLLHKIVLIVGICGACRKHELAQLTIDNIKDIGSAVLIQIPDTKTKRNRSFTITGKFYKLYKKYASLRPPNLTEKRFFINYQNKKCTKQVVGINKIAGTPRHIATYLGLEEPKLYTGHCYRRSSATFLLDAGGDVATLKGHGEWKST